MSLAIQRVLIVDDDPGFLDIMEEILRQEGFQTTRALDGKEGIEEIKRAPHDILFTGLIMPKISGERLIDYIRQDPSLEGMAIVMVSGALKEHPNPSLLGADYYIEKCNPQALGQKIQWVCRHIRSRHIRSEEKEPLPPFTPDINLYHRKIVEELLVSRRQSNQIFLSMNEGLMIYDVDHKIIEANPATEGFLGKDPNSLLTTPLEDHFEAPYGEKIKTILRRITGGETEEDRLIAPIRDKILDLH